MNRHLLASIYDIRGNKENAVKIYKEILSLYPDDIEAVESLKRLEVRDIDIGGLNKDMYDTFVRADSKEKLIEFERWLIG